MKSETHQTVQTNEPIIAVPTHVEPNLPPQPIGSSVPETILAIAVLIRSVALLIQAIGQQKGRK
jgi:hypothetical protein